MKPGKPPSLSKDAWITFGVTHNIKVDGDDSWPKVEIGDRVMPDETPDEAVARISAYVADKGIEYAELTARKVSERNKK